MKYFPILYVITALPNAMSDLRTILSTALFESDGWSNVSSHQVTQVDSCLAFTTGSSSTLQRTHPHYRACCLARLQGKHCTHVQHWLKEFQMVLYAYFDNLGSQDL